MHHEAQKLMTKGLPRKVASERLWPGFDRLVRENAGATCLVRPTSGLELSAGEFDFACQMATETTATRTTSPAMAIRRLSPGLRHVRCSLAWLVSLAVGSSWSAGIDSLSSFTSVAEGS